VSSPMIGLHSLHATPLPIERVLTSVGYRRLLSIYADFCRFMADVCRLLSICVDSCPFLST
jgi:hypothetical protein